ncbi:MAG: flagellar brake protein [Gammaproteobacteria bacterium]|nr:flagellar brake protein [Gammaproteobacteria bacterium]MCW8988055.1 flagellar brake protein [Gammaproteobacteria bacterium]
MAENDLDLRQNVGDTLQLQFSPNKKDERFYVKLIGFLENKSILVTTPRSDGVPLRIPAEQKFIVRMISGNSAQGFSAQAIHATSHPYPHLHLTYPKDLESITVRKAERVNCKLIVTVQNVESENTTADGRSASMQDISTAGSQLLSNDTLGEVGDTITINSKVNVADIEQYLTISGKIRRAVEKENSKSGKYEYGIEFILLEDKDKLLLHGFVYEQMTKKS